MSDDHFSKSLKIEEEAKRESLPDEILIDIIQRLPIKSIITWTSVSKSWNSLIKNRNFISTHLNHTTHTHNNLLLLRLSSKELVEDLWEFIATDEKEVYSLHWDDDALDEYTRFDFPFDEFTRNDFPFHAPRPNRDFRVVGTCNGLVCLADDLFTSAYNFFVWNPCIRKYVTLPAPTNVTPKSLGVGMWDDFVGFGYLPAATNVTPKLPVVGKLDAFIGFGFDSKTNDYKVVRIVSLVDMDKDDWGESPPKVDVYSLATGKWKTVTALPPTCSVREHDLAAFVNGALHWAVLRSTNDGLEGFQHFVLAFDLGDEDFNEIMLPKDLSDSIDMSVSVCGKSLAAFCRMNRVSCVHVWVMKEYGVLESWTKVLTVDSQGPEVEVPMIFDFLADEDDELNAVGFRKNGEVIIETEEGKIISIDSETKKIKDLRICGYGFTSVNPYVESLALLDKSEDAVSYQVTSNKWKNRESIENDSLFFFLNSSGYS